MLDPKWIRDHPDLLDRGLKRRGLAPESKRLIGLDEKRRAVVAKLQTLQERRNAASMWSCRQPRSRCRHRDNCVSAVGLW